jgi:NAD(P)-dependent dehydrogenase (short-subunit alcohol dehydrogenase family)
MKLDLQNKVFIVTGGASGIGESIVRRLADDGAVACIVDRNEKASMRLRDELCAAGKQAYYVPTELSRTEACAYAVSQVIVEYGQIDGLVNNAGLNDGVSLENGNYEEFIGSLHKNVVHYYNMGNFSLPYLKKSRGTIVNICSKVAETGQGGTSGYAAANGVRFDLTSEWAYELSSFGIRVNAVVVADVPEGIEVRIPLGNRMTTPDEIADTVLFLLSGRSGSVNGEFLHVDGGYVHLDK